MMKKFTVCSSRFAVAALLLLMTADCLLITGCSLKKKPQAVHTAAVTANGISAALRGIEQVNEDLYDARPRLVDYYETVALSDAIAKATIANDTFIATVRSAAKANDPAQVAALFAQLSKNLDDLNQKGILPVKNKTARDRLSEAFQVAKAALQAVAIELQIAKPNASLGIPPDKANPAATGIEAASTPEFRGFDAGICGGACGVFLNWKPGNTPPATAGGSDDAPSDPRALLRAGLSEDGMQTDLPEPAYPAPLLSLDAMAIASLIAMAVKVFGEGAEVVKQIQIASNLSDDELLAAAEKHDQETRDAVAAHLAAVNAEHASGTAVGPTEG
jgi:ribosomal protein S20